MLKDTGRLLFCDLRYFLDLVPTDVLWCLSDPGWAKAAYSNVYAPWIAGACVFIHSYPTFDPDLVLQVPLTPWCTAQCTRDLENQL